MASGGRNAILVNCQFKDKKANWGEFALRRGEKLPQSQLFFSKKNLEIIFSVGLNAEDIIKEINEVKKGKIYFRHDISEGTDIKHMFFIYPEGMGMLNLHIVQNEIIFFSIDLYLLKDEYADGL